MLRHEWSPGRMSPVSWITIRPVHRRAVTVRRRSLSSNHRPRRWTTPRLPPRRTPLSTSTMRISVEWTNWFDSNVIIHRVSTYIYRVLREIRPSLPGTFAYSICSQTICHLLCSFTVFHLWLVLNYNDLTQPRAKLFFCPFLSSSVFQCQNIS